ncbi:rod-binding protein [uncultured Erythrobacter sp.]|uniref:rod-binding protein n=1 Tax=uncultured Erythrobacter sp. TaxID=263913 RepID=UPI002616BBA9|nr:rod-binding protein [uncultured Erythrobacter sp.]
MIGPLGPVVGTKPDPLTSEQQELREAAQGFEAIMIRKMLESARETPFTEDAPLTGGGMKQYKTMRDEHFADIASQSGALGFARSIEEQLAQFVSPKIGE